MSVDAETEAELARARAEHVGPWTAQDLERLPTDRRFEIVDGELVECGMPGQLHGRLVAGLVLQIHPQLPPGLEVAPEVNTSTLRSVRVPDLIVARMRSTAGHPVVATDPADVLIVVEVVSPDSQRRDRVDKPVDYAAAGTPAFWRLEQEPSRLLQVHALERGAYRRTHEQGAGVLRLDAPFPLVLDLDALPR